MSLLIKTNQESYFRKASVREAEKFVNKSENKTKTIPCDPCEQTFEEKVNMKEHMKVFKDIGHLSVHDTKVNEAFEVHKNEGNLHKVKDSPIGFILRT